MTELVLKLIALIADALSGKASNEQVAKSLVDYAFESGVAPSLLMEYLSEKGKQNAEMAADIAEFAKLEVARMKKEGGL